MAGNLVLITGATGHLGFRVLRFALEAGYSVRAAVRSEAKAEIIRSNKAITAKEKQSDLSFVVVPDILAPGAYDEAVKDIQYIIHVASPLAGKVTGDYEANLINPAVQGTLNILEAAKNAPSVERVVITSSVVAMTPISAFTPNDFKGPPVSASNRIEEPTGPFPHDFAAYAASKVAALNRAEAWMASNNPSFDVIYIHPSFIEGRNDLATTLADVNSGTNRLIIGVATGVKSDQPMMMATNHVDDNAWIHVASLDPKIVGNQSFLVTSSGQDRVEWNDINEIVARRFPQAVEKRILSTEGSMPSVYWPYDVKKIEETFGIKLQDFESQVVSVVEHYLEIYAKQKGGA